MHNYAIPEQTFLDCLPFGIHFRQLPVLLMKQLHLSDTWYKMEQKYLIETIVKTVGKRGRIYD